MATRVTTELAESLVQYATTGRITTEIAEALVTFPPPVSPTMGQTFTDKLFLGSVATKPAISSVVGVPVVAGNAGDLALSDNGTLYVYDGSAWVATQDALPALTDGQLFIGSTGLPPVAATLTSGGGIDVTGGPGSIVLGSTAGGDLSGSVGSATVVGLQTTPVSATAPALNEVLKYDGAQWAPAADVAGSIGGTIAANEVAFGTALDTIGGSADLTWNSGTSTLAITSSLTALTIASSVDGQFLDVSTTLYQITITDPLTPTNSLTLGPADVAVGDGNQSGNVSAGYVGVTDNGSTNTLNLTVVAGVPTITSADGVAAPVALNVVVDELQINGDAGTSGYALTSNGGGSAPTWQAIPAAGITDLTGDVTATGPGSAAATLAASGINRAADLGAAQTLAATPTTVDLDTYPLFNATGAGTYNLTNAPTSDGRQISIVNTSGGASTVTNGTVSRTMSADGGSTWVYNAGAGRWFCTANV